VPLGGRALTLTDQSGRFFDRTTAWQKASGARLTSQRWSGSLRQQINHLLRLGVRLDHIDGNNHIHVFPGIAPWSPAWLTLSTLRECAFLSSHSRVGAQYVHRVLSRKSFIGFLPPRQRPCFGNTAFALLTPLAAFSFRRFHVLSLSGLLWQTYTQERPNSCAIPDTRVMAANPFSSIEREAELKALTHPEVLKEITRRNVQLIAYGEV